jgi:hypothetical protein
METRNNHPGGRHPAWSDLAGRLNSYKETHKQTAKNKGLERELAAAVSLTQARIVLFGLKPKKYVGRRDEVDTKGKR